YGNTNLSLSNPFSIATLQTGPGPSTTAFFGYRSYAVGSNPAGFIWGPDSTSENMKFEKSGLLHILDSTGTANLNVGGNAIVGLGAIGQTAPTDGLLVNG